MRFFVQVAGSSFSDIRKAHRRCSYGTPETGVETCGNREDESITGKSQGLFPKKSTMQREPNAACMSHKFIVSYFLE